MAIADYQAILGMGALFILFGIAALLLGRREKGEYYDSILKKRDIKEYITREPERPWLNAWKIGGEIALALGILLLIAGSVLHFVWR